MARHRRGRAAPLRSCSARNTTRPEAGDRLARCAAGHRLFGRRSRAASSGSEHAGGTRLAANVQIAMPGAQLRARAKAGEALFNGVAGNVHRGCNGRCTASPPDEAPAMPAGAVRGISKPPDAGACGGFVGRDAGGHRTRTASAMTT